MRATIKMNLFKDFHLLVLQQLEHLTVEGQLPAGLDISRVAVEPPRDPTHGDMATNAAMVLAKSASMKPRDLAALLAERLQQVEGVMAVEIAGPGFINLRLEEAVWYRQLRGILGAGEAFGESDIGQNQAANVEYVSANPTGPLTVGHARGAVVGDALASLLEKAGYRVLREYYVNDAGGQVDILAQSTYLRYREALGETIAEIPSGLYPGDYLKEVGAALAARDGDKWLAHSEEEWLPAIRSFAIEAMMELIRADLETIGIRHDLFVSERALVSAGAVDAVMETLAARDLIYTGVLEPPKGKTPEDWEPRPQTLFRSTAYGDDIDRPIRKSDGAWTYFANDMANHLDKFRRGYPLMLQVWGADHGGYVRRMKAAVVALTEEQAKLHVILCQLVRLMRGGEEVRMSKRSGNFVTLREVVEEVGKDVLRFMMLTRKPDAPLDFDLERVLEQSKDNPVFYVHYAHARICSVFRHAAEAFPDIDQSPESLAGAPLERLTDSGEIGLIKLMASWPRLVESAAEAYEPHRVAFYLNDLAAAFHGLWTRGKEDTTLRFLVAGDSELTAARLAMLKATAGVIASGLKIFGVEPLEEMR